MRMGSRMWPMASAAGGRASASWRSCATAASGLTASSRWCCRSCCALAGLLGIAALVVCLGSAAGLVAALLVACGFAAMAWICRRQIGGQTGDVLGALEQLGEMVVLLIAAAAQGFQ